MIVLFVADANACVSQRKEIRSTSGRSGQGSLTTTIEHRAMHIMSSLTSKCLAIAIQNEGFSALDNNRLGDCAAAPYAYYIDRGMNIPNKMPFIRLEYAS
jgi:hypothetical protein